MTNLNLDLIEKVKQGTHAIKHSLKDEDIPKLKKLLNEIFPMDDAIFKGLEYYFQSPFNHNMWNSSIKLHSHLNAIPLNDFFTNSLPAEDLSLIEQIDKRLKKLELMPHNTWTPNQCAKNCGGKSCEKQCMYSIFWETNQPIVEPKEGEPFHCETQPSCEYQCSVCKQETEFLAQEQGKEWKVGEWAWNSYTKTFIGIITKLDLSDIIEITLDNQDGKSSHFATSIMLVKPTTEEIQAHLVAIAEKKGYKPNVYIRSGKGAFKNLIEDGANFHYTKGMLMHGSILIWCVELGWATILPTETIAPIETEQRWKPSKGQLYYYVKFTQKYRIGSLTWASDETDVDFYELGNCFKSRESAQKVAEAIKQYLSTNKV